MATEIPYDGRDQDGDGRDDVDVDGDGWPSTLAFGDDCDDRDASVHPWALDLRGDGVDADCGGSDGLDGAFGGMGPLLGPAVGLVVVTLRARSMVGRFLAAVVHAAQNRVSSPT